MGWNHQLDENEDFVNLLDPGSERESGPDGPHYLEDHPISIGSMYRIFTYMNGEK